MESDAEIARYTRIAAFSASEAGVLSGNAASYASVAVLKAGDSLMNKTASASSAVQSQVKSDAAIANAVNTASAYDPFTTYRKGSLVLHSDILYKCKEDIIYPELWNASHWERTHASDELKNLIAKKQKKLNIVLRGGKLYVVM